MERVGAVVSAARAQGKLPMVWANPPIPVSQLSEVEKPGRRKKASMPKAHPGVSRIKASVLVKLRQMGSWALPLFNFYRRSIGYSVASAPGRRHIFRFVIIIPDEEKP
jgi:hypothetical protein